MCLYIESPPLKNKDGMKSKVVKWLLGVLGFSSITTSCEVVEDIIRGPVAMYGCPSADYVFNVEVEDLESGNPIEGIRVSAIERGVRDRWDEAGNIYPEPYIDTLAVGVTSAEGMVTLSHNSFPRDKHEIVADDVDGEKNGDYASAAVEVTVDSNDYKDEGENGWYQGTAINDVTLKLAKK